MGFDIGGAIPYVAGGFIISAAVALNAKFGKKVAEPSTSLYSMLTLDSQSKWRSSFVAGLLFVACLVSSVYGFEEIGNTNVKPFESDKLFFKGTGLLQFALSGLLIGFGTKLAQGGLTKYAFYGIPKFDYQSIVAVLTVLASGALTATIRATLPILQGVNATKFFNEHFDFRLSFLIPLIILGVNIAKNVNDQAAVTDILRSFGIGGLLAVGMMTAGFGRRHLILDFLNVNNSHWNPFLVFVALGAFAGSVLFSVLLKSEGPVADAPSGAVTPNILVGCAVFGVGLGITGLTPGSGLLVAPIYLPQVVLFFLPFVVLGQLGAGIMGGVFGASPSPKLAKTQ